MRSDLYTKAVLTVIALLLVAIASDQYIHPTATALAQGAFAGVQFSGNGSTFTLFDSRTGDVWVYTAIQEKGAMGRIHGKVSAPGGPATYDSSTYVK
jgi:predicted outer membrane protein